MFASLDRRGVALCGEVRVAASVTRRVAHTSAAGGGGRWDRLLSAGSGGKEGSDKDALDLVEGDLVRASVVEAGGAGAFVVSHLLGDFEFAASNSTRYAPRAT